MVKSNWIDSRKNHSELSAFDLSCESQWNIILSHCGQSHQSKIALLTQECFRAKNCFLFVTLNRRLGASDVTKSLTYPKTCEWYKATVGINFLRLQNVLSLWRQSQCTLASSEVTFQDATFVILSKWCLCLIWCIIAQGIAWFHSLYGNTKTLEKAAFFPRLSCHTYVFSWENRTTLLSFLFIL